MAYTGDVTRGGAPAVRDLGRPDHPQGVGRPDGQQRLPADLRPDDQLLIDAANDADTLLELIGPAGLGTVVTTHRHPDHWQALADVVEATGAESLAHADDAAEIPVVTDTLQRRRHGHGRRLHARGDPPGRAHARLDRAALPGAGRHRPPVDRRLPLPRRRRQHPRQQEELRVPDRTTWRPSSSAASPTTPGSTRATAKTPRSARSARTWPSGAPAAGDPARRGSRNRLDGLFRDLRGSH